MTAVVLCLTLFLFWLIVGYAVLALVGEEESLQRLLVAPVVGACVVVLPLFLLNQSGIPVEWFGRFVPSIFLLLSLLILWRRGPRVTWRDAVPFIAMVLLALVLIARPMARFGFNWVSFCNDDMANYCLGAQRVLEHGYMNPPDGLAVAGKDYSEFLWYLHVLHRPGSELVLATVVACTKLNCHEVFMPVIVSFHLCQVCAAGALAYRFGRSRWAVWLTMGLMAFSSLATLGTLYQLIAQVIGLAILAACVAVFMRPDDAPGKFVTWRRGVLAGILSIGLLIFYSELLPFLVISYLAYLAVALIWGKRRWKDVLATPLIAAVIVVIVLNRYVLITFFYLLQQGQGIGLEDPSNTLFPYYMVPTGMAHFWGLYAIGRSLPQEPYLSAIIAAALLMTLVAMVLVLRAVKLREPVAIVCLAMFALGAGLFFRRSGFGLYKLAMYLQPFLIPTLVLAWLSIAKHRWLQVIPLVALAALGLDGYSYYVKSSTGAGAAFAEIPDASASRVNAEFRSVLQKNPARPVLLDTYNVVLAKFQMLYSQGRVATFPSNNFLRKLYTDRVPKFLVEQSAMAQGKQISEEYDDRFITCDFDLKDPSTTRIDQFTLNTLGDTVGVAPGDWLVVGETGRQGVFNRRRSGRHPTENFLAGGVAQMANFMVFTASRMGEPYYVLGRNNVAVYQLENDPLFFTGETMSGLGRYLLFRVVNPSPKVRLLVELTDSFTGDAENLLPPAAAVGTERREFPLVGRGSARVFSPPFEPQQVHGLPFVALDLGKDGQYFQEPRTGLMRLYGNDVRLDRRQLVAFARDISLVSDDEYERLSPPSSLENFPADLTNPDLEYAGIFEDGWISERAFVNLAQPAKADLLVIRGMVPRIGDGTFRTEVIVRVNGKELARRVLTPGDFVLQGAVPASAGRRRIEFSFSALQRLPGNDRRPTAALLQSIHFEAGETVAGAIQH